MSWKLLILLDKKVKSLKLLNKIKISPKNYRSKLFNKINSLKLKNNNPLILLNKSLACVCKKPSF